MRWQFLMAGVVVSMALTACATPSTRDSGKAQALPVEGGRYDVEKMADVESQARVMGVQVYWINPPRAAKQKP